MASLARKLSAAMSAALLATALIPAQIVHAVSPTADVKLWDIQGPIGFNPDFSVADVKGLTSHVATAASPLTIVSTIENSSNPGGPCGLIFWNPATNTFKDYGITGGFSAGNDLNTSAPAMTAGGVTFQPGDAWVTVNGGGFPLYVNFKGSNNFRAYFVGSANGVQVDQTSGKVFFSNPGGGTISLLNPATNVTTNWAVGGSPHYLATDTAKRVYSAVAASAVGPGDAIVRIDPSTNVVTSWAIPGGGLTPGTPFQTPDGIEIDADGNVWFVASTGSKVGRLNPSTNVIDQFSKPSVSNPQLVASSGSGTSLQTFFTEGAGNSVSILTPSGATPVSTATVTPKTVTVSPATVGVGTTDFSRAPRIQTISPSTFTVTGVDPSGIVRFSPMPNPPARPFVTNFPSGMTQVAIPNTVFGSYLIGNAMFQVTSAAITAPPAGGPQATKIAFTSDSATTSDFGDAAKVAATLTDSSGKPVPGKKVTFTLTPGGPSGVPSCSGMTDATGTARCGITPNQKAGSVTLTAEFAGDSTMNLAGSKTSTRFTVTLEESTLNYTGPVLFANGAPAMLSGNLREDGVTPIFKQPDGAGTPRAVTFTLGSGASAQSCSGSTDATGTARCTITVTQPLGPTTVSANFASDGFYQPAKDSKAALVFAFLGGFPGNGTSFVIGDRNAVVGNAVTFWGAQWAKDNSLSGGAAPRAFKGFADHTSTATPACGGSWTTDPGNSSNPPDSVPSFMAVIASSSISKSGPTISGDIPHIVVVKTNPGYAPNPGHPGTGTVVAFVC